MFAYRGKSGFTHEMDVGFEEKESRFGPALPAGLHAPRQDTGDTGQHESSCFGYSQARHNKDACGAHVGASAAEDVNWRDETSRFV